VPASSEHTESRIYDEDFYDELENLLVKQQIEEITAAITQDVEKSKETMYVTAFLLQCDCYLSIHIFTRLNIALTSPKTTVVCTLTMKL
jgi:hypothetical protein